MATRKGKATPPAAPAAPALPALPPIPAGYSLRRYVVVPGGRSATAARTPLTGLQALVDGKVEGEAYYITKNTERAKGMAIGHVYDIPMSPDGNTFSVGYKRYVGEHEDKAAILTWQALELGRVAEDKSKAFEKKHADEVSALKTAVEPIRKLYQSLGTPSRVAFEVWLLNYIRKGIYF